MSKELKQLRGQLRQIVRDMLPEIITVAVTQEIKKQVDAKLESLEKHVKGLMHEMNERSKDTQSYLVRAVSKPVEPKQGE